MGHVGLVTAAVFADLGNDVVGADVDAAKIACLRAGECPFYEPGLQELLHRNLEERRIAFTTDTAAAVSASDIVFITVGAADAGGDSLDAASLRAVALEVARGMGASRAQSEPARAPRKLVVNKSTAPVGAGDAIMQTLEEHAPAGARFDFCANPEFLREGSAIEDALKPDRIVIGARDGDAAARLAELYAPLDRPIIITDVATAELIKYASNCFLATKISFINAIADMCELVGADAGAVAQGMGADHRIGHEFLQPGLGYGGSCFPKDVETLIAIAAARGCDFALLRAAREVNHSRVGRLVARMTEALAGVRGKTIGVLGLAFKPNTDDLREAKAVELIRALLAAGATVRAYDPEAMARCAALLPEVQYCENAYETACGCRALVVATEWNEFKSLNLARVRDVMAEAVIFDARNIFPPEKVRALGFRYYSVGRAQRGGTGPA